MTYTSILTARLLAPLLVPACLITSRLEAQTIIEIGTGTVVNADFDYPAPYGNQQNGARHQMLVLASELQAAGMTQGDISAFALNVATAAGVPLQSFTVSIGATSVSDMTNAWIRAFSRSGGPRPTRM